MRLMRHGLVGRLPRPANGDHARGAATMLQSAVVPTAAAPQSETMFVHSERWHNDQLGRSENFRSFRCVFRLLRAMCVDGTISIALVAQIVKTVQLTPADFRASTQTRHQNTAIRVEHRFEQRHHRYFTAHRGEGRDGRSRSNQRRFQCVFGKQPSRFATLVGGRPLSSFDRSRAPMPFQLALLLIHVHIVRCTTVRLRGKRNMGYGWGTMEG